MLVKPPIVIWVYMLLVCYKGLQEHFRDVSYSYQCFFVEEVCLLQVHPKVMKDFINVSVIFLFGWMCLFGRDFESFCCICNRQILEDVSVLLAK